MELFLIVLGLILGAIGAAMIVYGCRLWGYHARLFKHGVRADALIVRMEGMMDTKPIVSYQTHKGEITSRYRMNVSAYTSRYIAGRWLVVYYDAARPERYCIEGDSQYKITSVFMFIAGMFCLITALTFMLVPLFLS